MKMWFKGSCFFRNFPHWGVCSAVLGPCQGAMLCRPVPWGSSGTVGQKQGHPSHWGHDSCTQLPCWHRNAGSPYNNSTLLFDPAMPGVG